MNLEDLQVYQAILLANNIDKVFPDDDFLKKGCKSPKDVIAEMKDRPAEKIIEFILAHMKKWRKGLAWIWEEANVIIDLCINLANVFCFLWCESFIRFQVYTH